MSKSQSESQSQSGPHRERPTNSTSCRRAPGSNERNNNTDNTSRQGGGLRAAPLPHADLSTRLALSIKEAAGVLGVSEGLLRSTLHGIPHLRIGNRVVIPVDGLREWLRQRAQAEVRTAAQRAEEILSSLNRH